MRFGDEAGFEICGRDVKPVCMQDFGFDTEICQSLFLALTKALLRPVIVGKYG